LKGVRGMFSPFEGGQGDVLNQLLHE